MVGTTNVRVKIADVARHARVGAGTVSRVLNGAKNVSRHTRERVLRLDRCPGVRAEPGGARAGRQPHRHHRCRGAFARLFPARRGHPGHHRVPARPRHHPDDRSRGLRSRRRAGDHLGVSRAPSRCLLCHRHRSLGGDAAHPEGQRGASRRGWQPHGYADRLRGRLFQLRGHAAAHASPARARAQTYRARQHRQRDERSQPRPAARL